MSQKGISSPLLLILIFSSFILVFCAGYIFNNYFVVNISQKSGGSEAALKTNKKLNPGENPFCQKYGTYTVELSSLLELYTTKKGDTVSKIAVDYLRDVKKVAKIYKLNPGIPVSNSNEELPDGLEIMLPSDKYDEEGVSFYVKTLGNISYNETQPMFGVNSPNSGTGPFLITEKIKPDLNNIHQGDCVEVVYGSRGFDSTKPVFEVKLQK